MTNEGGETPFFIHLHQVWENPPTPANYDCCPICGSLGVIHFEDQDDSEKFHRCMRCLSEFHGCHTSPTKTTMARLNNASKTSESIYKG